MRNKGCKDERCWYKDISDKSLKRRLQKRFRPKASNKIINKNEWLTSIDILGVLEQYEKIYDNFDFMGPSPIDYNHVDNKRKRKTHKKGKLHMRNKRKSHKKQMHKRKNRRTHRKR